MPTQNRVSNAQTQSILSYHETISENLRLTDSLSWLVVGANDILEDFDAVSDAMLIISKLQREATEANDAIWEIVKGGEL